MRKVVASDLVSPDWVTESPEKWHLSYVDDEIRDAIGAAVAAADAMMFGRVTYKEFAAFGPNQGGDDQEFADCINNTANFVDSTTLEEPLENNSTLIKGSVAEEITKQKQPGKDISISGSGTLVRSLLHEDLLDDLRIMLHPIVAGSASSRREATK